MKQTKEQKFEADLVNAQERNKERLAKLKKPTKPWLSWLEKKLESEYRDYHDETK